MFSYKDRLRAVKFYIKSGYRLRYTLRCLGYPSSRVTLKQWHQEYIKNNQSLHTEYKTENRHHSKKYSKEQINSALKYYFSHGRNKAVTLKALGYPRSSDTLRQWLSAYTQEGYSTHRTSSVKSKKRYNQQERTAAVKALLTRVGSAEKVAELHKVKRATLYKWASQINVSFKSMKKKIPKDISLNELQNKYQELFKEYEQLQKDVYRLQMEKDILEKTGEILKKEEGINPQNLSNRDKTLVIDALKNQYSQQDLLSLLKISKSSFYYQLTALYKPDKYAAVREKIKTIFNHSYQSYGYRRIHAALKNSGTVISEKVVRKIMCQENIKVKIKRTKKYSSYQGEISPAVDNVIQRDFHSCKPYQKLLTDITEFALPEGKVYLSPLIDCFDGMVTSWTIGCSPNAELVNSMLDNAIDKIAGKVKPVIHSDRGCHYRWPGWIKRMEDNGFIRSMSKKGCSPDNSACEGFFGRLKNEFFYDKDWTKTGIKDFILSLDKYLHWYNECRIKASLGYKSPVQYRQSLGIME